MLKKKFWDHCECPKAYIIKTYRDITKWEHQIHNKRWHIVKSTSETIFFDTSDEISDEITMDLIATFNIEKIVCSPSSSIKAGAKFIWMYNEQMKALTLST